MGRRGNGDIGLIELAVISITNRYGLLPTIEETRAVKPDGLRFEGQSAQRVVTARNIGEIVGGSQREERLEQLEKRMKEMHIPAEELYWYLDTRKFGTAPHAGFGLGFERLVLFVTGMTNIRDVIPFPRAPKTAEF